MIRIILSILILVAFSDPLSARTWYIEPDGSGDAPTIAAAIDSSTAGDVIELACGTYIEWALWMKSGITIRSETGLPDCVTIDGNQPQGGLGTVILCHGADNTTLLEGLTITGGYNTDYFYGGAGGGLALSWGSELIVYRCAITGNYAKGGGGVYISNSHPTFVECDISGNESMFFPGGVGVGLGAGFTAYHTSILSNVSGSGEPDGTIREGSEANFHCCDIELSNWLIEGSYLIDDVNCDIVRTEAQSWGSLKALYR